jgi:hypothetical protein
VVERGRRNRTGRSTAIERGGGIVQVGAKRKKEEGGLQQVEA